MEIAAQPIGVFDSGIGGLTVAHAIKEKMPNEALIYFGDLAHLPYGDKSTAAIQAYSIKITDILLKKNCKAIVIACNSASSAAYDLLKEYTATKSKTINVIDPMVEYISINCKGEKVGLIGTKRTIESNRYELNLKKSDNTIKLQSLATPLLVPMIEEGFIEDKISEEVLHEYLDHQELQGIDTLVLGCTHYPLIKKQIDDFYNHKIKVFDSSEVVADALYSFLDESNLLSKRQEMEDHFLVSDFTEQFEASTTRFFGSRVHLEEKKLWE